MSIRPKRLIAAGLLAVMGGEPTAQGDPRAGRTTRGKKANLTPAPRASALLGTWGRIFERFAGVPPIMRPRGSLTNPGAPLWAVITAGGRPATTSFTASLVALYGT